MKKVKIAHDTVIYYTDRLGRRREKVVEVQENMLEPESYAECELLKDLHRFASNELLEGLKEMHVLVGMYETIIDDFNKSQIMLLSRAHNWRYEKAGPICRSFLRREAQPGTISKYTVKKDMVISFMQRIDEVVSVLNDDILFPMVEEDYLVLINIESLIRQFCGEFKKVHDMVLSECEKKLHQLLNVN